MKEGEINEQFLWDERLAPLLDYLPADQVCRVREALSLAHDAHSSQRRKSGEPFITHPVEVTRILAELKMDYESLAAGLLHDTVEDCGETVGLEEIGFHFGPAVQRIVEGETKFSKLPTHHPEREAAAAAAAVAAAAENGGENGEGGAGDTNSSNNNSNGTPMKMEIAVDFPTPPSSNIIPSPPLDNSNGGSSSSSSSSSVIPVAEPQSDSKAQDLQFLFLAMTEEVRIIVVKLADRLHNMRTMASMPPGKQRRIAEETLAVFAPLARLLGLYTIKEELEELSFMYAMPQQYAVMRKSVDRLWEQQQPAVEAAATELRRFLDEDTFLASHVRAFRVEVTKKALYSAWKKLQDQSKSVRDVSEIAQLRVVVDTAPNDGGAFDRQLCYHVMGLVHCHWAPVPGTMKDYIATPKPNNYQSLHTTVLPTGLRAVARGGNAPALFPIEVQIRTQQMERLAQYGIAVESWSCADYARSVATSSRNGSSSNGNGSIDASSSSSSSLATVYPDTNSSSSEIVGVDDKTSNGGAKLGALSWLRLGALLNSVNGNGNSSSRSNSESEEPPSSSANGSSSSSNGSTSNGASTSLTNGAHHTPPTTSPTTTQQQQQQQQNGQRLDPQTMSRRINWLNSIRQWQEEFVGTLTAQEFVACVTDDLLGQGVFVFTPSGQVMRLPKGATVVDFAYHIHTDIGNTMVASKVNGKVVAADHELANAEVVEVITYKGPPNATVIKRHQQWLASAKTKTARLKLSKFLREHAALAASVGLLAPGDSALGEAQRGGGPGSAAGAGTQQAVWLLARCDDRQGLLADIANVISRHRHNIRSYSGSTDRDAALFVMEYELEGPPDDLGALCAELSTVECVRGWEVGCAWASPLGHLKQRRI